jgi:hypothetical protein
MKAEKLEVGTPYRLARRFGRVTVYFLGRDGRDLCFAERYGATYRPLRNPPLNRLTAPKPPRVYIAPAPPVFV